jgi:hypothetical protein
MTAADSDAVLWCSAGECHYRASRIGHVTVRATTTRDERLHMFWLPICDDHARALRGGATLVEFDSGL